MTAYTLVSPFCILSAGLFVSGCTISSPINDRLSYAGEKKMIERFQSAPSIHFDADDVTKTYQHTAYTSGFAGKGTALQFPIGWTFVAYLEQAAKVAFRPSAKPSNQVSIHLSSCDMKYTYSGFGTGVDWVDIALTIDTYFSNPSRSGNPIAIKVHRILDAPMEKTSLSNTKYSAMAEVMEGLVSDYLDEVVRLSPTLLPGHR